MTKVVFNIAKSDKLLISIHCFFLANLYKNLQVVFMGESGRGPGVTTEYLQLIKDMVAFGISYNDKKLQIFEGIRFN